MDDARVIISHVQGTTMLAVVGEMDIHSASTLSARISQVIQDGAQALVIDLTRVEFLDSTGLGVLVAAHKKLRANQGSLKLVCHQERILKLFRITGLMNVFEIHDSAESATALPRGESVDGDIAG